MKDSGAPVEREAAVRRAEQLLHQGRLKEAIRESARAPAVLLELESDEAPNPDLSLRMVRLRAALGTGPPR
jgi:hypothetical protein